LSKAKATIGRRPRERSDGAAGVWRAVSLEGEEEVEVTREDEKIVRGVKAGVQVPRMARSKGSGDSPYSMSTTAKHWQHQHS
jgi:hypothetical protein